MDRYEGQGHDEPVRKHGSHIGVARVERRLTGGACVSLYTGGAYHSKDVDFVLGASVVSAARSR